MQKKDYKKLEFEPYRGPSGEVIEGKNTVLKLYEDRMDYRMKFNALTYFSKFDDEEEQLSDYVDHFEEGAIVKEAITAVTKKIEPILTTVDKDGKDTEPVKKVKHVVLIEAGALEYAFYMEHKEDWDRIYKEVYNWKFNIKDE